MPATCSTVITETAKAASIASDATPPETAFGSRRPSSALTRKPANGKSGIKASSHHFNDVSESGLSDSRWRKSAMISARPTAASAAATVITKKTMIWPSTSPA